MIRGPPSATWQYFPDVEVILLTWHDRQIAAHLTYLSEIRDQGVSAGERLEALLEAALPLVVWPTAYITRSHGPSASYFKVRGGCPTRTPYQT